MTGDASDSDSEEELMEYMYMRRAHHPPTPRMVMKMEDRGMSRRMIKELMYGHPAHYRDEYRLKGIGEHNIVGYTVERERKRGRRERGLGGREGVSEGGQEGGREGGERKRGR